MPHAVGRRTGCIADRQRRLLIIEEIADMLGWLRDGQSTSAGISKEFQPARSYFPPAGTSLRRMPAVVVKERSTES